MSKEIQNKSTKAPNIETKKCKHCQSDIPKKAKICPVCKKKQKAPVFAILLIFFGILVFIGAIAGTSEDSNNSSNAVKVENSESSKDSGYATMEKFEKIETGMTYEEVVEIMGSKGELMSEVGVGDITSKLYCWYAKNGIANMNITFSNGKVLSKAQVALD